MLSHLRLHRRAPSTPGSPVGPDLSSSSPSSFEHDATASSPADLRSTSSNSSSLLPPTLPPITRVTSESDLDFDFQRPPPSHLRPQPSVSHSPVLRSPYHDKSGFIGGVALANYRRGLRASGQAGPINLGNSNASSTAEHDVASSSSRHVQPTLGHTLPTLQQQQQSAGDGGGEGGNYRSVKASPAIVSPTHLQPVLVSSSAGVKPIGKRPSSARVATESVTSSSPTIAHDPPKAKKSLPFLKNPMSTLLMRRKSSQPVPELHSLPVGNRKTDIRPTNDPSIRGTWVHDFSAPRRKNFAPGALTVPSSSAGASGAHTPKVSYQLQASTSQVNLSQEDSETISIPSDTQDRSKSNMSASNQPSVTASSTKDVNSTWGTLPPPLSLERKPLVGKNITEPPTPPNESATILNLSPSTIPMTALVDQVSVLPTSTPSIRTTRLRNISLSDRTTVRDMSGPSAPKHMKSTSSRFSFDMIGADKQEKLLEERHRQREQEKHAEEPSERDSRYDDFDEDGFDYDAMNFEPGLEERIPGVNDDYDGEDDLYKEDISGISVGLIEEEENYDTDEGKDRHGDYDEVNDPDNDQENFAGFEFQRSKPASNFVSPRKFDPRDSDGSTIGFAMTRDYVPDSNELSPELVEDKTSKVTQETNSFGLGIQNLELGKQLNENVELGGETSALALTSQLCDLDFEGEFYFDNGLQELGSGSMDDNDAEPFDESLFDLDDTDQYGRPLPGVFAKVQALRQSQRKKKGKTDGTLRISPLPVVSKSITHTFSSGVVQQVPPPEDESSGEGVAEDGQDEDVQPNSAQIDILGLSPTQKEQIAMYQAALAATAQQAAASGKFRRGPSPAAAEEVMVTSPTTTGSSQHDMDHLSDFDDDGFENDMDAYEFDEDIMVAEANASVLASDSDGFYGHEFGFYSAPATQNAQHNPAPQALSTENLFQYANGGYFGPSGVNRTKSGRVVSREPNLTPITERSEYSNRNSIMSGMGIPPTGGTNTLLSPGLVQLAALASEDDNEETMSLSALLRLRSRAWGGSQVSLTSSRDGSPRSETGREGTISPWGTTTISGLTSVGGVGPLHARQGSSFSIMSKDSESGSGTASPTLTMSTPFHPLSQPSAPVISSSSLVSEQQQQQQKSAATTAASIATIVKDDKSPGSPPSGGRPPSGLRIQSPEPPLSLSESRRGGQGYHHKMGSADSISYVKEKRVESGETRWVMERRRTADSGEVEILGREVVDGGRI